MGKTLQKKKIFVIVIVFIILLQLLQSCGGGDLLFGYSQDSHNFNIYNEKTGHFGMTFTSRNLYISIPNPFKQLSYRVAIGKFIMWGTEGTLEERNTCVLGYHFYPAKNTKT